MEEAVLAPIVQKLDIVIHGINLYPVDKCKGNQLRYPVDRVLYGGYCYPPFEYCGLVHNGSSPSMDYIFLHHIPKMKPN